MKTQFTKTTQACDHCKRSPSDGYLEDCGCGLRLCAPCSPLMHHDCAMVSADDKRVLSDLFLWK